MPHSMSDLSSKTRNQTHVLCMEMRGLNTGPPGMSLWNSFSQIIKKQRPRDTTELVLLEPFPLRYRTILRFCKKTRVSWPRRLGQAWREPLP